MWVLRYESRELGQYFYYTGQNLYLSTADMVEDLQEAKLFDKYQDAVNIYNCMNNKTFWSVWSVQSGWILDKECRSHLKQAEIKRLEAELARLRSEVIHES